MLDKLDPKQVPAICREMGIVPRRGRGSYISEIGGHLTACCVGIDFIRHAGIVRGRESICRGGVNRLLVEEIGLSDMMIQGMSRGWEDESPRANVDDPADLREGIRIGREAWQACVDEGLVSN